MPRWDDEISGIPATLRDSATQEKETVDALIEACERLKVCLKTYHYDLQKESGDSRAHKDKILKLSAQMRQYFSALEGEPRPSKKRKSTIENSGFPLTSCLSSAKSEKHRAFESELEDLKGEKKKVQQILKKLISLRQKLDHVEKITKNSKETLSLRRKVATFYKPGNNRQVIHSIAKKDPEIWRKHKEWAEERVKASQFYQRYIREKYDGNEDAFLAKEGFPTLERMKKKSPAAAASPGTDSATTPRAPGTSPTTMASAPTLNDTTTTTGPAERAATQVSPSEPFGFDGLTDLELDAVLSLAKRHGVSLDRAAAMYREKVGQAPFVPTLGSSSSSSAGSASPPPPCHNPFTSSFRSYG